MNPDNTTRVVKDGRGTDSNPDPITGQPGAIPVGTGVGAALAGAAPAPRAAWSAAQWRVVGAVIGGVAGGLAGKGVAESIDPTVEDRYWPKTTLAVRTTNRISLTTTISQRTSTAGNRKQKTFTGRSTRPKRCWRDWDSVKARSTLTWEKAKHATARCLESNRASGWLRAAAPQRQGGRTPGRRFQISRCRGRKATRTHRPIFVRTQRLVVPRRVEQSNRRQPLARQSRVFQATVSSVFPSWLHGFL